MTSSESKHSQGLSNDQLSDGGLFISNQIRVFIKQEDIVLKEEFDSCLQYEVASSIAQEKYIYNHDFKPLGDTPEKMRGGICLPEKTCELFPTADLQHSFRKEQIFIDTPVGPPLRDNTSILYNKTEHKYKIQAEVTGQSSDLQNPLALNMCDEQNIVQICKMEVQTEQTKVLCHLTSPLGIFGEEEVHKLPPSKYIVSKNGGLEKDIVTLKGEILFKNEICEESDVQTLGKKKTFKCDMCCYSAADKNSLFRHKRIHTGDKPFKCVKCPYSTSEKGNLVRHVRNHSGVKPFKCEKCNYSCSDKTRLALHIRTHSGEKPFKCDICNYRSVSKPNLKYHKGTHSGVKPYMCEMCNYSTSDKCNLVRHMRTHTGEKPFKCDVCLYSSAGKSGLVRHSRIHTGEKPFECDICNYSSGNKTNLMQHKRTHTGEKPFMCEKCPYSTSDRGNLVRHNRTHTGVNPFTCKMCRYTASKMTYLSRHMRTHTVEEPFTC